VLCAGRTWIGVALASAVCAGNLAVVALVDSRPQLQRGDWRGVAAVLRAGPAARAVVVAVPGADPLEYYLPPLARVPAGRQVRAREIDLIGYAPIRADAHRPPANGFAALKPRSVQGIIVLRFRASHAVSMSRTRLLGDRLERVDTQVLAPPADQSPPAR
jgi:hypothetical protein